MPSLAPGFLSGDDLVLPLISRGCCSRSFSAARETENATASLRSASDECLSFARLVALDRLGPFTADAAALSCAWLDGRSAWDVLHRGLRRLALRILMQLRCCPPCATIPASRFFSGFPQCTPACWPKRNGRGRPRVGCACLCYMACVP